MFMALIDGLVGQQHGAGTVAALQGSLNLVEDERQLPGRRHG
jgi:hypothetical protein